MKKVFIFAASGYGLKVAYHLGSEYEITAIVDNNPLYKGIWGGV
ncbi:MAG: hypothetical protein ACI4LX_05705 [Treponema sp.]